MKEKRLSFESENFQIHYLTLTLSFNNLKRTKKITDYSLSTFDCNSIFVNCTNSTENYTLVKKERNLSKDEFRVNSQKSWYRTSLSFSGNHSTYFVKRLKRKALIGRF